MSLDITPLVPAGRQIIQSYGGGRFSITGKIHTGAVLVMPDRTVPLAAASPAEVRPELLAGEVDILLIGGGAGFAAIPDDVRDQFRSQGVAVEIMDTGGACRTFNVLVGEDRRVAAMLFPVA